MRKKISVFLVVVSAVFLIFSGCTLKGKEVYISNDLSDARLFTIGEETCSMKEAKVYLLNTKNIYGQLQGQNLLGDGFDAGFMSDSIKAATIGHLTRVYCMLLVGDQKGITLSDEDKKLASDCAKEYSLGLSVLEQAYLDISVDELAAIYEHYILAQKVYNSAMSEVNSNVTEDECRIMDASVIYTKSDADAAAVLSELNNGSDFYEIQGKYSQLSAGEISFGKGEYSSLVEEQVFALDNDMWCGPITAGGGYYFFKCENKYNAQKSEENKATIIAKRRADVFEAMLERIEEENYSKFNSDYWSELSLDELNGLNSDSFFEVLNQKVNN